MTMQTNELRDRLDEFRGSELPRLRRLQAYYRGQHPILSEKKEPRGPDNRLVCNFCRSITDSTVGYFMGIPVTYGADDPESLKEISRIMGLSDEPFVNSALARDLSVYGRGAELFWCGDDGEVHFAAVSPETVFPVYSENLDERLLGAVRTFRLRDGTDRVQYMDDCVIRDYTDKNGVLALVGEREHYFGAVPANFYRNNRDMAGDFEQVLTLVDAYNKLQSECVNDFDLFADSYLAISGMGGTTAEDMAKIRQDRVLLLDEGGDAKWLTKTVNDSYIENLKTRIVKDIYRFSGTADIAEVDGAGSLTSGVAMKYRMVNFENRVAVTEQFFRRGLMARLGIIRSLYGNLSRTLDLGGVKVIFTRNMPGGIEAAADLAAKLDGIVSRQTLYEILPFTAPDEMERMRKEQDDE